MWGIYIEQITSQLQNHCLIAQKRIEFEYAAHVQTSSPSIKKSLISRWLMLDVNGEGVCR